MSITATIALGGVKAKVFYGSLVGGALGFLAGKLTNSNKALARHLHRFGKELSSDPELSFDLFDTTNNSSSTNNDNHIDYQTSKRDFQLAQRNFNPDYNDEFEDNYNNSYEGTKYYKDYNRFRPNYSRSDDDCYDKNRMRSNRNYEPYRTNYDLDNYTNNYDINYDINDYNNY